jgi:peptidoglycan hydrolase CwlO-like protein
MKERRNKMFRKFLRFLKRIWKAIKDKFAQEELNEQADKIWEEGNEIIEEMEAIERGIDDLNEDLQKYSEQDKENQAKVAKASAEHLKWKLAYEKKWAAMGKENNPEYAEIVGKIYATERHIIEGDAFNSSVEHKNKIHEKKTMELEEWFQKNLPEKRMMEESEKEVNKLKKEAYDFRVKYLNSINRDIADLKADLNEENSKLEQKQKELSQVEGQIRKNRAKAIFYVLGIIGSGFLLKGFLNPSSVILKVKDTKFFARFNDLGTFLKFANILVGTLAEFKMIDPLFQSIFDF